MTAAARVWLSAMIGAVVIAWAWLHGPFDGANVLVMLLLSVSAYYLWRAERREAAGPRCPHCGNRLGVWTDPAKRRGDGI